jgi:hypothetical protein
MSNATGTMETVRELERAVAADKTDGAAKARLAWALYRAGLPNAEGNRYVQHGQDLYELQVRNKTRHGKGKDRSPDRTTIYVGGVDNPLTEPATGAGSPRGVDKVVDRAWDAYNRGWVDACRGVLLAVLPLAGYSFPTYEPSYPKAYVNHQEPKPCKKVVFSKKAGCSCPCSPGFLASVRSADDAEGCWAMGEGVCWKPLNIWITRVGS